MLNSHRLTLALSCALLLGLVGAGQASAFTYVSEETAIARGTLAGKRPSTFITGVSGGKGVAVDADHIYWVNDWTGTIGRANLDGSGADQNFITGSHVENGHSKVLSVAVDGGHIYWNDVTLVSLDDGEGGTYEEYRGSIARANLDGTGVDRSFIMADGPTAVAVDAGHVYWASLYRIGRANLDGTGVEPFFIHYASPYGVQGGLAVDESHIYWSETANAFQTPRPAIARANLDGSGVNERFITAVNFPKGLAVHAGHIYWANSDTGIGRANLDGSGANMNFATPLNGYGIAVDALLSRPSSTSVSCTPSSVLVGSASTCTVTVTDTGGAAASTPSGSVVLDTPLRYGVFEPRLTDDGKSGRCELRPGPVGSSSCTATWTPANANNTVPRTDTITARYYPSDALYDDSAGSTTVSVRLPDTTAPATTIDGGPSGSTVDSTPTFTFSSDEAGSTFECRIGNTAFASCTSPYTSAALGDGAYTFEVRATDAAGNVDQTPDSRTFTVDATSPVVTIDGGPSGLTNDTTPTFAFSSDEPGAPFECRVGSGAFRPCTSPETTAALTDGTYTFEVRATDAAGNIAAPASRTFTVDASPPDTTLTSGPTGRFQPGPLDLRGLPGIVTNDSTPTFAFSSNDQAARFECRVDAKAFGSCSSPHTTASLADGQHTFTVRAEDAAGNADPSPASVAFTVAPQCTLIGISVNLGGSPLLVCLVQARSASAGSGNAPRIVSSIALLTRAGRTYATGKATGAKQLNLKAERYIKAGFYTVRATARTDSGRTRTGRCSVWISKAQAKRLNRAR